MLNSPTTEHTAHTPLLSLHRSPPAAALILIPNDDADGNRVAGPLAEHKLRGGPRRETIMAGRREE